MDSTLQLFTVELVHIVQHSAHSLRRTSPLTNCFTTSGTKAEGIHMHVTRSICVPCWGMGDEEQRQGQRGVDLGAGQRADFQPRSKMYFFISSQSCHASGKNPPARPALSSAAGARALLRGVTRRPFCNPCRRSASAQSFLKLLPSLLGIPQGVFVITPELFCDTGRTFARFEFFPSEVFPLAAPGPQFFIWFSVIVYTAATPAQWHV